MTVVIPGSFLAHAARGESWQRWLDALPRLLADVVGDWRLSVDGGPWHGECGIVVPVRTADGDPAALKAWWPHEEAELEHLALRDWAGRGAVRLLRADPRRSVLLLERADGDTDLSTVPVVEACEVIAGLHRRLAVAAGPQYRRMSEQAARWAEELEELRASPRAPRRYVERAIAAAVDFAADASTDGTLIHTDLHYVNVLRSLRTDGEPWLAIDPKPMSGDLSSGIAPLLWNRFDEATVSGDLRGALQSRFFAVVDALGLDEDRAREWVVLWMVVQILWALHDEVEQGRDVTDELTRHVATIKAMER